MGARQSDILLIVLTHVIGLDLDGSFWNIVNYSIKYVIMGASQSDILLMVLTHVIGLDLDDSFWKIAIFSNTLFCGQGKVET